MFDLHKLPVDPEFGLDRFHCIYKVFNITFQNISIYIVTRFYIAFPFILVLVTI